MLVATADACSASRPGARRESLERYIKRMEELESIASGFAGVEQAFAIQAGRELRVIASARDTDDVKAAKICRDIAKAFEAQPERFNLFEEEVVQMLIRRLTQHDVGTYSIALLVVLTGKTLKPLRNVDGYNRK